MYSIQEIYFTSLSWKWPICNKQPTYHLPESDLLNLEKSTLFCSSFNGTHTSTVILSSDVSIGTDIYSYMVIEIV